MDLLIWYLSHFLQAYRVFLSTCYLSILLLLYIFHNEMYIFHNEIPSLLLLKKNSLITSPRSSFKAALHFFFPTSIPRLFTFKPSLYFLCWLAGGVHPFTFFQVL